MKKIMTFLPIVLGAGFLFLGTLKFSGQNPVFETIASRSGLDVFAPYICRLVGVMEVVIGLMLIVPVGFLRYFASVLGLMTLISAIGFHLSPWLGINVPGVGHGLFFTALFLTAINLILVNQYFGYPAQLKLAKVKGITS